MKWMVSSTARPMTIEAMSMVIKTLSQTEPYQHQVNGALVLAHLGAIQFAKNHGLLDEYIEHDRKMMEPVNFRIKKLIEETGNKELALEAVFDITECHYQLVLDTQVEPGKRTWVSPFRTGIRWSWSTRGTPAAGMSE